jgi:hypothetical protein
MKPVPRNNLSVKIPAPIKAPLTETGVVASIVRSVASTRRIRSETSPDYLPLSDVKIRLYGDPKSPVLRGGIIGYNRTQLAQGQPWHCTTVARLAELFCEWGHDPMKHLKEIAEIGFLPVIKQVASEPPPA